METCRPWKIFQTEMSFTAFSKKINVFLRLQNTIKISNVTLFTSAQRQLCVLFFCQKSRYFSSPSTFAFFRPKPIEVVAIVIRILQLCLITAYTQIAAHLEFRFQIHYHALDPLTHELLTVFYAITFMNIVTTFIKLGN